MQSLAHFLTAVVATLPMPAHAPATMPRVTAVLPDSWAAAVEPDGPPLLPPAVEEGLVPDLLGALAGETWHQVRIEQRLVIRITPPRSVGREVVQPPPMSAIRFRERKMANCLPVLGIAGVQPTADSRLMLFMRDRRIIGANLDKQCSPADFYMGFYIHQTQDGLLCAGRDSIHSRSGSTCALSRLRELVPSE